MSQLVIEMQGGDKQSRSRIWTKMREGQKLEGAETYIGRSMADHPEWFPIFETMDVLGGDDTQPNGENPFAHLTFHILVGSQIFHQQPPEAEVFFRMRLRQGDDPHDIVHMMINAFQRHLAWAAQQARKPAAGQAAGQVQIDLAAYGQTLKTIAPLKTKKLWERLGYETEPDVHGRRPKRKR